MLAWNPKMLTWSTRRKLAAYAFIAPALGIIGVFVFYPIVRAGIISFQSWDLLDVPRFVGTNNYSRLVGSPSFREVLYRTFEFVALTTPTNIVLALFLAIALNRNLPLKSFWRGLIFLPAVTSMVAIGRLWQYMYAQYGVVNYALSVVGIEPVPWLSSTELALPSIVLVSIWYGVGWNVVLFLAGLQSVPAEYYEAAVIDGAGKWKCFSKITVPLLRPIILFVAIVTLITQFRVFDLVFVMTQGGPGTSTMVIMMYLYRQAFMMFEMGQAAAIAFFLLAIVLILSAVQMRLFRSEALY